MIKSFYNALPGPTAFRMFAMLIVLAAVLVALHFIYTWMGDNLLDTGGSIG